MIGSEGVIELVNENPREEDARIVFHGRDGAKELFSFRQGDTYRTQMLEWAGIVRDSVRRPRAAPRGPDVHRRARVRGGHRPSDANRDRATRRSTWRTHMTLVPSSAAAITHRLAIIDLIVGYFAATDAKSWDVVEAFYTDDAVVRFNPESETTGRSRDRRVHALDVGQRQRS